MIVLRSPKAGPVRRRSTAKRSKGSGVPTKSAVDGVRTNPAHLEILENWMRSYRPEELFDDEGCLLPELQALAPAGARRMGANPHANGGLLKRKLELPDYRTTP